MIDKILQESIIKWLRDKHDVEAVKVQMYDTDVEIEGCGCSGEWSLSFIIGYWQAADDLGLRYAPRHVNVDKDPIVWLWYDLPGMEESDVS